VIEQRRTVSGVDALLLTLIVSGLGLMIGQVFEPLVSLLLALAGVAASAVAFLLGKKWSIRGRLLHRGRLS
jgi:CHASE2 domain-containing sensor protein